MRKNNILSWLLPLCLILIGISCKDSSDDNQPTTNSKVQGTKEVVVAVVLPMDGDRQKIWNTISEWFLKNLQDAQRKLGADTIYMPKLEYYDENTVNLAELGNTLATREDVKLVIGPLENHNVEYITTPMFQENKPVIAPCCTSEEVCHKLSGKGLFWSLCESDVTELTMMLAEASSYISRRDETQTVSLITSKTLTGNTYLDWFEFEATEMKLNIGRTYSYAANSQTYEIKKAFNNALHDGSRVMLCAPTTEQETKAMIEVLAELYNEYREEIMPECIFSNMLYSPGMLGWEHDALADPVFGYFPIADPATGFSIRIQSYNMFAKEGSELSLKNTAQFYDALMISALAIWEVENGKASNYGTAIADVVADSDDGVARPALNGWDAEYLYQIYKGWQEGIRFNLSGASGSIQFVPDVQSSCTQTIYASIMYGNGDNEYELVDYLSRDGTTHTNSNSVKWQEQTKEYVEQEGCAIEYGDLNDQWALLVAGSTGWDNYRHTADVLNVYHMLKESGYPDDHIVVIADPSLLDDPRNPNKGTILRWDNLVLMSEKDNFIDYQIKDLRSHDIFNILNGKASSHLPNVLYPDSHSNVLVYWSGHGDSTNKGTRGTLLWNGTDRNLGISTEDLESFLEQYQADNKYRKMLWILEPCYSASVAKAGENKGIKHTLFLTSAMGGEPSKLNANSWRDSYQCYMSDLFTQNLVSIYENDRRISYNKLYKTLVARTYGSHPQILGASTFGLLSDSYPIEFFSYLFNNKHGDEQ